MPAAVPYFVYTRDALTAGSWELQEHLICDQLTRGLSPTIDSATLRYHFGTMAREGEVSATYYPALDLARKFVRITVPSLSVDWVGYVLTVEGDRWPQEDFGGAQRLVGGDQTFGVVGLEWFLSRKTINSSIIEPGNEVGRALDFNAGFGEGRDLIYAKRGNKDTRSTFFAEDKDHAELWNARQIVDYLTGHYQPQDKDGNNEPATYVLALDAVDYLEWFEPTVKCEGHSLFQVLNDIINFRRGLAWWIQYDDALNNAEIHVTSVATADITIPGGATLPMNGSQIVLSDVDDWPIRPRIGRNASRRQDLVVCRGARRRAVFTVSVTSANLEPSWQAAEETAYRAGVGGTALENDRFRQQNRFERVYQMFNIPAGWDGRSNDGGSVPGGDAFACPHFIQGSGSILGAASLHMPGLRLLNSMPLKVSYDYDDATAPTARDPDLVSPEFQRPFGVVSIESDWRFIHEINTNQEGDGTERKTSYHLLPLEGVAGFQVAPGSGMAHSLALNHFDPENDGESDHLPEVDYETMRFTVSGEWDEYCEGQYPIGVGIPDTDPLDSLYIYLPERLRFDWLADGTIYDIQDGALATCSSGGALQDDRTICEQIAQIAWQWYGEERAEVAINFETTELPCDIGDLITTIGSGAAAETVNAIVSQVTMNLERGGASFSAGFGELDFEALV